MNPPITTKSRMFGSSTVSQRFVDDGGVTVIDTCPW